MALQLPLSVGKNLNWNTKLPIVSKSYKYESPIFIYMKLKWKLVFGLGCFEDIRYYIALINCDGTQNFTTFSIYTHLQFKQRGTVIQCNNCTIECGFNFLYCEKKDVVDKAFNITLHTTNYDATVTCTFHPSNDIFFDTPGMKEDKATDNPEKDFNSENDSNLPLALSSCSISDQASPVNEAVPHFQSISEDLGSMFDNDLMSDVKIKCGDVVVSAHKDILAARSKYFANMLQNENYKNISIFNNLTIKSSVLRTFIRYMYTGEVKDISEDNVLDLYSTSYEYEVHALHKECSQILAKCISLENYLNILTLAGKYSDESLKEAVGVFVSNQSSLLATDNWINFSKRSPVIANEIYRKFAEKVLSSNIQT